MSTKRGQLQFLSELLQEAWFGRGLVVEVLRAEVDASGFDICLEANGVLRHVQLKTSRAKAKTASQKLGVALGEKRSGCVVWIIRHENPSTNRITLSYRFFGGGPGEPLPSLEDFKVARSAKADMKGTKKERPGYRVVPKGRFKPVSSTSELINLLFGTR